MQRALIIGCGEEHPGADAAHLFALYFRGKGFDWRPRGLSLNDSVSVRASKHDAPRYNSSHAFNTFVGEQSVSLHIDEHSPKPALQLTHERSRKTMPARWHSYDNTGFHCVLRALLVPTRALEMLMPQALHGGDSSSDTATTAGGDGGDGGDGGGDSGGGSGGGSTSGGQPQRPTRGDHKYLNYSALHVRLGDGNMAWRGYSNDKEWMFRKEQRELEPGFTRRDFGGALGCFAGALLPPHVVLSDTQEVQSAAVARGMVTTAEAGRPVNFGMRNTYEARDASKVFLDWFLLANARAVVSLGFKRVAHHSSPWTSAFLWSAREWHGPPVALPYRLTCGGAQVESSKSSESATSLWAHYKATGDTALIQCAPTHCAAGRRRLATESTVPDGPP